MRRVPLAVRIVGGSLLVGAAWALVAYLLHIENYTFMLGTGLLMLGAFCVAAVLWV